MLGNYVERRFGWDTHGLPIEMLTEKEIGLNGRKEILEYGIDRFNEACRSGVLRYVSEWEKVTERLGRWIDFVNDYKTMDLSFMDSVWWVFKQLWDQGRVYEGARVVPYSWRLSTPFLILKQAQTIKRSRTQRLRFDFEAKRTQTARSSLGLLLHGPFRVTSDCVLAQIYRMSELKRSRLAKSSF